jgi:proteasome accessory factor C
MDQHNRIRRAHQILNTSKYPVSRAALEKTLSCSPNAVKRTLEELRNMGAVIDYDKENKGYFYNRDVAFELPGMWFTPDEIFGLIAAHDLLTEAEPSLLANTLKPLRQRLDKLLQTENLGRGELPKRVRIIRLAGRGPGEYFAAVSLALVERKQLQFDYRSRTSGQDKSRKVSPQRIAHYRDNWYLDAWCHADKKLKSYAMECILNVRISSMIAKEIAEATLHEHYASSYGIFAGKPIGVARLIFTAHRAQWVSLETWHPKQIGKFLDDGRYQLDIPYSDTRELMMDILKNGVEVEVVSPPTLRKEAIDKLRAALQQYTKA